MTGSLVFWIPYLNASLAGFPINEPEDSGRIAKQFVEAFFMLWIVPWLFGLLVTLIALAGWLSRTRWVLMGLTGVMIVVSGIIYAIGAE